MRPTTDLAWSRTSVFEDERLMVHIAGEHGTQTTPKITNLRSLGNYVSLTRMSCRMNPV